MKDLLVYWNRPLGRGGEGNVYLCYWPLGHRYLAIKFSNCTLPWMAQRQLAQELRRSLQVVGDRVMRPVDWNLEVSEPFRVYEFASKGTLRTEMEEFRVKGLVYHPALALVRIKEILLAVRQLHASGVI